MHIYHERLMDHYRYPRNAKKIDGADFSSKSLNPSCGDSVAFSGTVHDGTVIDIAFSGTGCVISQATASLLSEYAKGKSVTTLLHCTKDDILTLIGMELGPVRLKCALLPLQALQQGITDYISQ